MADQDDDYLQNPPIRRLPVITPPMVDPSMIQLTDKDATPLSYTPPPISPAELQQIQPIPVNLQPSASARQIASMIPPSATDPQYRPSNLRTAFNAIASGLAGIAGGPKVGMETGKALRDYKYDAAMQDYRNRLALAEAQQRAEQQTFEQAVRPYQIGATTETAASKIERARHQNLTDAIRESTRQAVAATGARKVDIDAARVAETKRYDDVKAKYMQSKIDNPKLDDAQFMFNLPEEEQAAFKKLYQELHPNQTISPEERARQTAAGRLKAQSSPEGLAAEEDIAKHQTLGRQAGMGIIATPEQQNLADQLTQQLVKDPDNYDAILAAAGTNLAVRETALSNYLKGDDLPKKLSPTERTATTNARTAIGHISGIKELLADPEIQKNLGPIKGRLLKAANAIGDNILKKGPEGNGAADIMAKYGQTASAKEQKLLSLLAYLITFEASSTSGTRPSWQLIHYLGTYSPRPEEEIAHFVGSIQGVESSALNRIKSATQFTKSGMPVEQDKNIKTTPQGHEIEILDDKTKKKKDD